MKYIVKYYKYLLCILLLTLAFNLYYIFLISNANLQFLLYLDLLLSICFGIFMFADIIQFHKKEMMIKEYLNSDDIISSSIGNIENIDVLEHNMGIFQQRLQEQMDINQDLQDFITKWCHEVKIPLSAAMLMNEKMIDDELKFQFKEQLEKINQYLNSALISCKVQGNFYDIQVIKMKLKDSVHTSIKNNRYFLIKNHVDLQIELTDDKVYTDPEWLVYILDQLLMNAIKYAKEEPKIHIWNEHQNNSVLLYIKDYGEGVKDYDLPRIFERGYVGSNHHNGKYKSTGMGLYMVMIMIRKLGLHISVDSTFQEYTRFCITFKNIEKHFNL